MRCPRCGHDNLEDVSYCAGCLNLIDDRAVLPGTPPPAASAPVPSPSSASALDEPLRPPWASSPVAATPAPRNDAQEGPATDRNWLTVTEARGETGVDHAPVAQRPGASALSPPAQPAAPSDPIWAQVTEEWVETEVENAPVAERPGTPVFNDAPWLATRSDQAPFKPAPPPPGARPRPPPLPKRKLAPAFTPAPVPTTATQGVPWQGPPVRTRAERRKLGLVAVAVGAGAVMALVPLVLLLISSARNEEKSATDCRNGRLEACERLCTAHQPSECGSDRKGCARSADACLRAGDAAVKGLGPKARVGHAFTSYERACQLGHPSGCDRQGVLVLNGLGTRANEPRALSLFKQSCQGKAWGCLDLGLMYHFGRGTARDAERARGLFRQSCPLAAGWQRHCNRSEPVTCGTGALLLAVGACGPAAPDRAQAFAKHACDAGYRWPCERLEELARSEHEANLKACRGGQPAACGALCFAVEPKACSSRRDLCVQAGSACNKLGWLFQRGEGTGRDASEAAKAFRRSCQFGDVPGCDSLGFMYLNGQGVGQDETEALRLFEQACETNAFACLNVGLMLHFGRGGPRSPVRARELFARSCSAAADWRIDCQRGYQEECGTGALLVAIGACGEADAAGAWPSVLRSCAHGYDWPCERFKDIAPPE